MRVWRVQCIGPGSSSLETELWIAASTVTAAYEIAMAKGYTPLSAI